MPPPVTALRTPASGGGGGGAASGGDGAASRGGGGTLASLRPEGGVANGGDSALVVWVLAVVVAVEAGAASCGALQADDASVAPANTAARENRPGSSALRGEATGSADMQNTQCVSASATWRRQDGHGRRRMARAYRVSLRRVRYGETTMKDIMYQVSFSFGTGSLSLPTSSSRHFVASIVSASLARSPTERIGATRVLGDGMR